MTNLLFQILAAAAYLRYMNATDYTDNYASQHSSLCWDFVAIHVAPADISDMHERFEEEFCRDN